RLATLNDGYPRPVRLSAVLQRLPVGERGRHAHREPRQLPHSARCHKAARPARPVRRTPNRLTEVLCPRRCTREVQLPVVQRRDDEAGPAARTTGIAGAVAETKCSVSWLGRGLLG